MRNLYTTDAILVVRFSPSLTLTNEAKCKSLTGEHSSVIDCDGSYDACMGWKVEIDSSVYSNMLKAKMLIEHEKGAIVHIVR